MHSVRHAMNLRIRAALEFIAYIVVASLIWMAVPVQAHSIDCSGRAGIDLARCERHQKMADKCGPLQGEAHFACDREFMRCVRDAVKASPIGAP